MSTKPIIQPTSAAPEDDIGALIYRASQLRKAEAAAVAAKKNTASTPTRRTLTRKRSSSANSDGTVVKEIQTEIRHLQNGKAVYQEDME